MNAPVASNLPPQARTLLFAVAFRDVFVPETQHRLIRIPLEVDALGMRAWRGDDATYRISATGDPAIIPSGIFPVSVNAPNGEYLSLDPITVSLPRPVSTPPIQADFLEVHPLWPSRRFRIPSGETAVIGVITKLGVPQPGLRVWLHPGAVPPSGTPEARTDVTGQFVYRFPFAPGAASDATPSLTVTVFDGAFSAAVTPASLTLEAGRVHTIPFQRL